ncbi:response regulator [Siccirubricoccus sp. G192]|uniref:response regulator n=1 Tax=Siccirubricoccus sp. G192 TaxID=2849651 RepID=UPI001C2BD426|nr:response regulator [Siccirubricoccus sp. G192]MBV1797030.1 response regulator [Siccirubricoccus sp. G192]
MEDEALVRLLICDCLLDEGMAVAETWNAECAFGIAARRLTEEAVLVTDLNLGPRELNGLDLAAEMRRRLPRIGVVYVTGNPEWVIDRGRPLEDWERLVAKPFLPSQLVEAVRAVCPRG